MNPYGDPDRIARERENGRLLGYRRFFPDRARVYLIYPAITTLSLLVFLWSWNNYLLPLIIINKPELYTIPLGITSLGGAYRTDLAAQILGLTVGTVPLLILFAVGSKSFFRGLTAGSVKG